MPATNGSISEVLIGTGVLYIKDRTTASLAFPTDASGAFDTPTSMTPAWEEVGYKSTKELPINYMDAYRYVDN